MTTTLERTIREDTVNRLKEALETHSHSDYCDRIESVLFHICQKPRTLAQFASGYLITAQNILYNFHQLSSETKAQLIKKHVPAYWVVVTATSWNKSEQARRQQEQETEKKIYQIIKGQWTFSEDNNEEFQNLQQRASHSSGRQERCRNCGNSKSISVQLIQSHSSDEPMTQVYECSNCGANWTKYN